ncbi:hypothetical protein PsorP6_005898 [Peronosclerospora sorghi]|uniref:Uncharacterized protein n=1 Tax=Peronosclerospora sorghi TaxID=230839 RepID=A0ACC0W611_9STRA|nr:hypothetical protein PsorP6_005898 [Peronosclerospora sorghi]
MLWNAPFAADYLVEAVRALDQGGRIDWTPSSAKVRRERCDVRASGDRVVVRDDALHLYALDDDFQYVWTRDTLAYFQGYGPSYVEWINDSSCTIVFQDDYTAMRALVALGHEIPSNDVEMEEGDATQGPDDQNECPPDDKKTRP